MFEESLESRHLPLWRGVAAVYRGINADVIVYILAHLHTTLRTEGNMLDKN